MAVIGMLTERAWVASGRPYCKVYPRMAELLSDVDLSRIPVAEFAMPFPAIEVSLPTCSLLLWCAHRKDNDQLVLQSGTSDLRPGILTTCSLAGSSTIQEALDAASKAAKISGQHSVNDEQSRLRSWRIAISTALFMTNKHRLVMPDLEPRMIRLQQRLGRRRGKKGRLAHRAAAMTLGREIELPRPNFVESDHDESETGRELEHSHLRRAHLAYRWSGPGKTERKLVFIFDTVVRPDLPPPERRPAYCIPGGQ